MPEQPSDQRTTGACPKCGRAVDRMHAPVGEACRCMSLTEQRIMDAALRRSLTVLPDPRAAEIERLRAALTTLQAMAGGHADHEEMLALIDQELANG